MYSLLGKNVVKGAGGSRGVSLAVYGDKVRLERGRAVVSMWSVHHPPQPEIVSRQNTGGFFSQEMKPRDPGLLV